MRIKFGVWGKEGEDIKSGKVKEITREIDRFNPVFEDIEKVNLKLTLYKIGEPGGIPYFYIDVEGDLDERFMIKKISYLDGKVIISW
jgi:hypothetical protein